MFLYVVCSSFGIISLNSLTLSIISIELSFLIHFSFLPPLRTCKPPSSSSTFFFPTRPNTDCCTAEPPLRFTSTTLLFTTLDIDCSNNNLDPNASAKPPFLNSSIAFSPTPLVLTTRSRIFYTALLLALISPLLTVIPNSFITFCTPF
nr:MAG TPA: hypothetical protein [Caudoviricetes sp.]